MLRFVPVAIAALVAVYARQEWRRVNAELDRARGKGSTQPIATLRRDETTGEWRPSR